jgi:2-polyprenyl-3-methyl-5-hydroxy-6-metoxy-1,4-benzoquinol methylase
MKPHDLLWTPERIQTFWDHYSSHIGLYFSAVYGRSLIGYVRRRIRIGTPLDYGCGRGHLLASLAAAGFDEVYGVDQSPESRILAGQAIGDRATAHLGDDVQPASADTAFLIEVVEHMDDEALGAAFDKIRLALKPGGHVVITTPNDEDLKANSVLCPECHSVFHRMQHVRAWNAKTLSDFVESRGFKTVSVEATILSPYSGFTDYLYRTVKRLQSATPNLIYIGRKT